MKRLLSVICILYGGVASSGAKEGANLYPYGDMEKLVSGSSGSAPLGWHSLDALKIESDSTEARSGETSLKVRTPENSTPLASEYIPVKPNTAYEVEASVLARGDFPINRPSTYLRISGDDDSRYPAEGEYLIAWLPSEEGLEFVTKKAHFVTGSNTRKVRISLLIRRRPSGIVNVDDVILREVVQTE